MLTVESDDTSRSKKKIELDSRLFAHIHLDHRLIGSHLQGSTFSVTANYLLETLTYFSSQTGAESIVTTLNPAEMKQTLDLLILQFKTLVDIEDKIREEQRKLKGEISVYTLTEEMYEKRKTEYKNLYLTPTVVVDKNNIPKKLIIKKNNKMVIIEPVSDYPDDLLICRKILSGHPVAEWLQEKGHVLEFDAPDIDTLANLQKIYIKPISESILEKINVQNRLLIPGGWRGESSGHAMLYQLIKNPNGSYIFIVYNTGSGLEYHIQQSTTKEKFVPFMAYKISNSVKATELEAFITDLLTPQIAPELRRMFPRSGRNSVEDWEEKKIYNAKRIYKEVIEKNLLLLQAEPIDNLVHALYPEENKSVTIQGQLSGTCAMRVFEPFLEVNMPRKAASIFLYESDLRSIFTYYDTEKQKENLAQPNNLYNSMVRRQLLQSIRRIAIKTGKLSTRNTDNGHPLLNQEKANNVLKKLSAVETELKELSQITSKTDVKKIKFFEKLLHFSSVSRTSSADREILFITDQVLVSLDLNLEDKNYGSYRDQELAIFVFQKEDFFEIYYKKIEQGKGVIAKIVVENTPKNEDFFSLLMQCKTDGYVEKSSKGEKVKKLIFELIRKKGGLTEQELTNVFNESDHVSNIIEKTPERILPQKEDINYMNNPYAFLKACYEAVFENDRMGYSEAIKFQIENLLFSFPLNNKEALDRYWQTLSREKSRETLMYLQCILRIYAKNCGQLNPYPNAIQTITANTGFLMGSYIVNRFFDNKPIFEMLTARLPSEKFPISAKANTLDPTFDQRMIELQKLIIEIKEGKNLTCEINDHYDMAFLKYMSSSDPGVELLKEQYIGSPDELRQHFYAALKGSSRIPLLEETKKSYDVFLQFMEMQEEYWRLLEARYNYFYVVNTDANQDEFNNRLQLIEYTKKEYWNKIEDEFFYFESEKFKKSGEFRYNRTDLQKKFREQPLSFDDFLKVKNNFLRRVLYVGNQIDSNATLLRDSLGDIPRTIPFLGQSTVCRACVTKDFFESNFDLLNKRDYQIMCLMNLFSPKALEIQISNNIHFVEELKRFLEEGLRYHSREAYELSSGGVFIFKVEYFLLKYLQYQPKRHHPEIESVLQWLEEQNKLLLEKIRLQALHGNEKTARELLVVYFLKLSLLEASPEKRETIKQNLPMLFSCLLKSRAGEKDDLILNVELMRAAQKIKPYIQEQFDLLSSDEKQSLMKTVLQEILVPTMLPDINKLDEYEMSFKYPVVKIDSVIEVDLSLGKVESTKGRIEAIPSEFYNDERFRSLFGQFSLLAMRQDVANYSIYHFNFQDQSYKIINQIGNALAIQTKPPGETNWFELVNKEHIYTVSARYRDIDCFWWRETNVFPRLPNDYCTSIEHGYLIKIERDTEAQNQICFELHHDGSKTNYQYLCDDQKENSALYDVFRNFESSENIEVWGVPGQNLLLRVKLPRYNLAWDVTIENNELIFVWSKKSDFKLIINYPHMIEGFSHALYMRNEKTGEEIAIIPNQEFYVEDIKKHDGEYYELEYDTDNIIPKTIGDNKKYHRSWQTTDTQKYSEYSIINNELFAETLEEYLQLAYIYLAKHDPEHAMWALRQCRKRGPIQGTRDEVNLLMKLIKDTPNEDYNEAYYSKAFVEDPESITVRLYASYLLAEQKQKSLNKMVFTSCIKNKVVKTNNDQYREETDDKILKFYEKNFNTVLKQIYQSYRKVLSNIPENMQLDYNQRLFLLRGIESPTEVMRYELVMLEYMAAREQKKQFTKKLKQMKTEKPSESDIKILSNLNDTIKTLDILLKEMDDKRKRELATVFSAEMVFALEGAEFIDMRQFLPSTPEIVKSDFKQQVDALSKISTKPIEEQEAKFFEQLPFLERQQEKYALEIKVGAQKNIALKAKIGFYEQYFTKDILDKLRKEFSAIVTDSAMQKEEEKDILRFANKAISGSESKLKTTSELMGNIKSKLQFGDLIWLYLQGDQNQYIQKTKLTDPKKIQVLHLRIHEYLLKYTEDQYNKRVLKYLSDLEVCEGYEYQDAIIKLGNELSSVREYDPKDDPEILIFEYLEDLLLRNDQITVINGLLERGGDGYKNKIVQLIMGFGKSKILLPLMALKRADGTNVSFIEIPSNLFGPGFTDLSEKTKRLFGKGGLPFIFNRDSNCSSDSLKTLHYGLLDAMRNRDYIVTTPESMLSLELKYLELTLLNEVSLEEQAQIITLENILTLIAERGDALIEECDTALEKKKELNYTIGSEEPVKKYQLADTLKIFKLFDQAEIKLASGIRCNLKEVMLRQKEILNEDDWDRIIETLATLIMKDKKGPLKFVDFKLPEEAWQKQKFLDYILNKTDVIPDFILKNYDWNQKNHIGLVKGELVLLRNCLRKKPSEAYGFPLSNDYPGKKTLAIPYVGNNEPNERAKFSTYETIIYTTLLHKQKGILPEDLIISFISDFRAAAKQELLDNVHLKELTFDTTKAARKFDKLTGMSLGSIQFETFQLGELQYLISHQEKAFDYVLQNYILSDIKVNKRILKANRINHVSQFRSASGVSGTPWNVHSYNQRFEFDEKESLGVDGITIDHLVSKNPLVYPLNSKDPSQIIQKHVINNENFEKIRAFLDVGSIFEGKSNLEIAQLFAEQLRTRGDNQIKHVLYFNDENKLSALPVSSGSIIVIDSTEPRVITKLTGSKPENRFTYYDQRHTTGIDIEQAANAIGVVSIDSRTKARDCWQGVMRLRKLSGNQTVEFILPDMTGAKDFNDVRKLVEGNQINQLAEIHLPAVLINMDNVIREHFKKKLFNCQDMTLKLALRKKYTDIFDTETKEEGFDKFGAVESETKLDDILSKHQAACLNKLKALDPLLEAEVLETLNTALSRVAFDAKKNCLPSYKYARVPDAGLELEVEKEKEQEKEQEKELEQESETSQPRMRPVSYKSWNDLSQHFPTMLDWNIGYNQCQVKIDTLNKMVPLNLGFSGDIFVSENYQKTYIEQTNYMDKFIKPITLFLVIKESDGKLKILLITQDEYGEFLDYLLVQENKDRLKENNIQMWVVSPHNTILYGTSNKVDEEGTDYQNLLSQIQYFNADLNMLSRSEQFDWLLSESTYEKMEFLENEILKNYSEKKKHLHYFKNIISQKLTEKLAEVNQAINIPSAFESIRIPDEASGLQIIDNYLSAVVCIENKNLQKLLINFSTVKEDGKNLSLLGLAIKFDRKLIIQRLLDSGLVFLSCNIACNPMMLAIEYKHPAILKRLIKEPKLYPHKHDKVAWFTLVNAMLKHRQSETYAVFWSHVKTQCAPDIINELIEKAIKKLIVTTGVSDATILKTLQVLSTLTDRPFLDVYKKYLSKVFDILSPDEVLRVLGDLYDASPNVEVKNYLTQLGSEIERPDVFAKVMTDLRFSIKTDEPGYWAQILSCHIYPGTYLHVLEYKMLPQNLDSLIEMSKIPAVTVNEQGQPISVIFSKKSKMKSILLNDFLLKGNFKFPQLLVSFVNNYLYGYKKIFLAGNDPLLEDFISLKEIKLDVKPTNLEFLLPSIMRMDNAQKEQLSQKLAEVEIFKKLKERLFPSQNGISYSHYHEPPFNITSLPRVYLDMALMFLGAGGFEFLMNIHGLLFMCKELVANDAAIFYQNIISKLDFTETLHQQLGKFYFKELLSSRIEENTVCAIIQLMLNKGFSFKDYNENDMPALLTILNHLKPIVKSMLITALLKNESLSGAILQNLVKERNWSRNKNSEFVIQLFSELNTDIVSKLSFEPEIFLQVFDVLKSKKSIDFNSIQKTIILGNIPLERTKELFSKALQENAIEYCRNYLRRLGDERSEEFNGDIKAYLQAVSEYGEVAFKKTVDILNNLDLLRDDSMNEEYAFFFCQLAIKRGFNDFFIECFKKLHTQDFEELLLMAIRYHNETIATLILNKSFQDTDTFNKEKKLVIQSLLRKSGISAYEQNEMLSSFRKKVFEIKTLDLLFELGVVNTRQAFLEVCNLLMQNLDSVLDVKYLEKLIDIHEGLEYEGKGTVADLLNSTYSNSANLLINAISNVHAAKALSRAGVVYDKEAFVKLFIKGYVSHDMQLLTYLVEIHPTVHYEGKGTFLDIVYSAKKLTFQYDSLNKNTEKKDQSPPDDSKPAPTGS